MMPWTWIRATPTASLFHFGSIKNRKVVLPTESVKHWSSISLAIEAPPLGTIGELPPLAILVVPCPCARTFSHAELGVVAGRCPGHRWSWPRATEPRLDVPWSLAAVAACSCRRPELPVALRARVSSASSAWPAGSQSSGHRVTGQLSMNAESAQERSNGSSSVMGRHPHERRRRALDLLRRHAGSSQSPASLLTAPAMVADRHARSSRGGVSSPAGTRRPAAEGWQRGAHGLPDCTVSCGGSEEWPGEGERRSGGEKGKDKVGRKGMTCGSHASVCGCWDLKGEKYRGYWINK
jgi:hypothetical protein